MKSGRKLKFQAGELADTAIAIDEHKEKTILQKLWKTAAPAERLTLSVWADKYRVLPQATSSEHGPWRTKRFPFLTRPMFCMSPQSAARMITIMKGAQLGFTETLINKILYNAEHYPGPTMYVQKTLEAAKDFAAQKLEPSIEVCSAVRAILGKDRPYAQKSEALSKNFPGGFIVMGGANSGAFLRSKSIRDALIDEEDSFKLNTDGEGSPVALIRKRQANFPLSKMARVSTPRIRELSTIEPAYKAGSQEQYFLPCPKCNPNADRHGAIFVLKWDHIKWGEELDAMTGVPKDVWCECPFCGERIDEASKTWMLEAGRWLSNGGDEHAEPMEIGDVEYPSFWINSLYSPLGFFSWHDAVEEFFEYKRTRDRALLQVFENQTLANTWTVAGQDVSSTWAESHKEDYINPSTGEVVDAPQGVLVITAGVDIQKDRIEAEVVGWGLNQESWSIDYAVFWGPPDFLGDAQGDDPNTGQPTVWKLLDQYLTTRFKHTSGAALPIECTLIDGKYKTEEVHIFCKVREHRRIYVVVGASGWGKGHIKRPNKRTERWQTWRFDAYVDEIKDRVYSQLLVDVPGPGYCHFPNKDHYDKKYFQGLTSENKKVVIVGGRKIMKWECPQGARNEPLDIRGYALAALQVYAPNLELRAQQQNPGAQIIPGVGSESGRRGAKPSGKRQRRRGSKGLEM